MNRIVIHRVHLSAMFVVLTFLSAAICQERDLLNYYPLNIGDQWHYENTTLGTQVTYEVVGEELKPNGKLYKRIEISNGETEYQRIDTTRLIVLQYDGEPVCLDSLNETELYHLDTASYYYWNPCSGWLELGVELRWFGGTSIYYRSGTAPGGWCTWEKNHTLSYGLGRTYMEYDCVSDDHPEALRLIEATIDGHSWVSISETKILPKNSKLFEFYPNPFNNASVINYEIPIPMECSFTIYDILGRMVFEERIFQAETGEHQYQFHANDFKNYSLESGIYVVRVVLGNDSYNRKLLLLR